MWTQEERNRVKEALSKVVYASATGAVVGAFLGVAEKCITGKGKIRSRVTDGLVLSGTYALTEAAIDQWKARTVYTPVIAGCVAGATASSGSKRSLITLSVAAAGIGWGLNGGIERLRNKHWPENPGV